MESPFNTRVMRGEHHVERPSCSDCICFNWSVTELALQPWVGIYPQWLVEFITHLVAHFLAEERDAIKTYKKEINHDANECFRRNG